MKPLLCDHRLQGQLERDGFVTVPLFRLSRCKRCLRCTARRCARVKSPACTRAAVTIPTKSIVSSMTSHSPRDEYRRPSQIFLPSRIYGGTFMVKSHLDSEMLPLHQDWSVVEEGQYSTLFVWCPLVDVSVRNGRFSRCREAIAGSAHCVRERILRTATSSRNRLHR